MSHLYPAGNHQCHYWEELSKSSAFTAQSSIKAAETVQAVCLTLTCLREWCHFFWWWDQVYFRKVWQGGLSQYTWSSLSLDFMGGWAELGGRVSVFFAGTYRFYTATVWSDDVLSLLSAMHLHSETVGGIVVCARATLNAIPTQSRRGLHGSCEALKCKHKLHSTVWTVGKVCPHWTHSHNCLKTGFSKHCIVEL